MLDEVSVEIYTTQFCPFCVYAKQLLDSKGVVYQEHRLDGDPAGRKALLLRCGVGTVPQIWVSGQYVGGCDELYGLESAGTLDTLLEGKTL